MKTTALKLSRFAWFKSRSARTVPPSMPVSSPMRVLAMRTCGARLLQAAFRRQKLLILEALGRHDEQDRGLRSPRLLAGGRRGLAAG